MAAAIPEHLQLSKSRINNFIRQYRIEYGINWARMHKHLAIDMTIARYWNNYIQQNPELTGIDLLHRMCEKVGIEEEDEIIHEVELDNIDVHQALDLLFSPEDLIRHGINDYYDDSDSEDGGNESDGF